MRRDRLLRSQATLTYLNISNAICLYVLEPFVAVLSVMMWISVEIIYILLVTPLWWRLIRDSFISVSNIWVTSSSKKDNGWGSSWKYLKEINIFVAKNKSILSPLNLISNMYYKCIWENKVKHVYFLPRTLLSRTDLTSWQEG